MSVNIKDLAVSMDVGPKGVEFEVKDKDNKHLGNIHVTRTYLIWCAGKTQKQKGKKLTWKKFADMLDDK